MVILSAREFGEAVKAARRTQQMTQGELAFAIGTGVRFIVDLERGKPTCQLGKAIQVAVMLGISLEARFSGDSTRELP